MWREGSSRNLPWVMFDVASLEAWAGVSQEGFPFSLSSRGAQTVLVTPLNSTATWFLSERNLEESLWAQMWAASPVLGWGSGSVLQNCCKTEFCGLRDKVLRILQQMLPGCWVTDNCGRFVPGNGINFSFSSSFLSSSEGSGLAQESNWFYSTDWRHFFEEIKKSLTCLFNFIFPYFFFSWQYLLNQQIAC